MEALLRKTETGEFEDNGWLSLINSHWDGDDLELVLELKDGFEVSENTNWVVRATTVHEYKIFDANDCGLNHFRENHVAISQYTDKTANLFFQGTYSSPYAVVGSLYEAHTEVAQDWIEFEKYLNTNQTVSSLIEAGFGKLADGPVFLLKEYMEVLRNFGIKSNIADQMPPKRWNGMSWVEFSSVPELLHFGGSYVIADRFHASMQQIT